LGAAEQGMTCLSMVSGQQVGLLFWHAVGSSSSNEHTQMCDKQQVTSPLTGILVSQHTTEASACAAAQLAVSKPHEQPIAHADRLSNTTDRYTLKTSNTCPANA
jgi:hypothetical protein